MAEIDPVVGLRDVADNGSEGYSWALVERFCKSAITEIKTLRDFMSIMCNGVNWDGCNHDENAYRAKAFFENMNFCASECHVKDENGNVYHHPACPRRISERGVSSR